MSKASGTLTWSTSSRPTRSPVIAAGGRMELNFGGAPVCCLAIYPKSLQESAETALDGVRKKQRAEFDKKFKLDLPNPKSHPN